MENGLVFRWFKMKINHNKFSGNFPFQKAQKYGCVSIFVTKELSLKVPFERSKV